MIKKIMLICFISLSCFGISQIIAKGNPISVKNGFADYEGIKYLIYTGITAVYPTPKESVYGSGINFNVKAKNMNDAEKEAQKVINFYMNKNINGVAITDKFTMSKGKTEVYYNSSNKNNAGKGISIMISQSKEGLSVLIIPN